MAIQPIAPSAKQQAELSKLCRQLSRSPADIHMLLRRAAIFFSIEDHDSAIADLDAVIRINPQHVEGRINRANAYSLRNEADKAISDAGFVLGLRNASNRDLAQAHYIRGRTYAQMRRFADSLTDLDQTLQRFPDHDSALLWRSKVVLGLNRFEECVRDCSRILGKTPQDASTLWRRASCYARLGKTAEALRDSDSAIAANPELERAYVERALLHRKGGKLELALADINSAIALRVKSNADAGSKFRDDAPLQRLREEIRGALGH